MSLFSYKLIPKSILKLILSFGATLLIICFLAISWLPSLAQTNTEEQQVKSNYAVKREKISSSLGKTKEVLDQLKASYGELDSQKKTYQEQKKANQEELDQNNQALTDFKFAVAQLDEQISVKESEIEDRKAKIKIIIQQLWQEKKGTTIEVLLGSENFSEIISGFNQLSTLEDSLVDNVQSLNQAKVLLEQDRQQKLQTQQDLQDAQIILNANQQKFDALIQTYANNQEQYAIDIAEAEKEAAAAQAALNSLQKEQEQKLAEIKKRKEDELRKQAEALAMQNNPANEANLSPNDPKSAKQAITNNSGTTSYGSCNPVTIAEKFPIKFGTMSSPYDGVLTQKYGSTTLSHSIYNCHNGIDLAGSCGDSLTAVSDGVVFASDYAAGGYGHFIVLEHNFGTGGKLYSLYAHMKSKSPLPLGGRVSKGDIIGLMGSTGFSTGCHIHFTLIDGDSIIYDRSKAGSSPVGLYYNPLDYFSI